MSIHPFRVNIPQTTLEDLQERLAHTRWPDEIKGAEWEYGTNRAYLKTLVEYWQHGFDWRKQEAKLNRFEQFHAQIDGLNIHFIHERGKGPNPLPIILTHGWPDSFYRMHKIIPLLTDPASYGGDSNDAFDVIVPSIPGFGFSERPTVSGMTSACTTELWAKLMTEVLGYQHFTAAGGDIGSRVTRLLALAHPDRLIGIHLTDVGYPGDPAFTPDMAILAETEAGQRFLGALNQWWMQEGAYNMLQATRPQTLAYGLNDSPVGLASWQIEKFRAWSDCNGKIENRFTKDELLTNSMIYWTTQTIASSIRIYYDDSRATPALSSNQRIEVPTGIAHFPKELLPPREFAEHFLRIERWTEMPRGGHFAALEEPELLAEDMQAFFRPLRTKS